MLGGIWRTCTRIALYLKNMEAHDYKESAAKGALKLCKKCNQIKPLSDFNYRNDLKKPRNDCSECRKFMYIMKQYKVTKHDYTARLKQQNGCCAICGELQPLCVDHCHVTGDFRGLLCSCCNRGIGLLQDDIYIVNNALNYLRKWKTQP